MTQRLNIAFTAPINPPGATPHLTQAQVWKGLERKIRHAEEFVPVIESCEAKEERVEDGVPVTVRVAKFKAGVGPPAAQANGGMVEEVCRAFEPSRVDFIQPNGSTVSNIVSVGEDGGLCMTYSFEWIRPDLDLSTPEKAQAARDKEGGLAKMAVLKSLEAIREMVKDGRINV